ncbi:MULTISPECIES: VOC family protein [unclassified Pseudactinotalea]|uniref:VOC family protein n=1 Tax=unclassified Pseudactinotalea TaxID=2649176 RepID=UPI00128D893A|nr:MULTISPECIES: VOC family protein [unclassified Pseudactinotalea]MPV49298.1 VOC family protein [Pseudactinotalea sp. HY160]QGH69407.1 VOC family protein [Pseudactinotalea sp. HY158]
MTITIHHAFLPQTDPDAAIRFYRDVLGFEVHRDVENDGLHWITVGPPGRPETTIVLHPPAVDPGLTEDERRTVLELIAKGSYAGLTLATDDLDGLFERLVAAGADILQEPADQFYGVRDAAVRDPSGNLLRINQA